MSSKFHISLLPTALQSQSWQQPIAFMNKHVLEETLDYVADKQTDKMEQKYRTPNIHLPQVPAQEPAVMFMQIRKQRSKRKLCK